MAATLTEAPERTDLEALAELRESRFQQRYARITADTALDGRLRALLLDRTIWSTQQIVSAVDISSQRISVMRGNAKTRTGPHPSSFPDRDVALKIHNRINDSGVEAGRVIEWALQAGRMIWNGQTGQLEKVRGFRHGRRRTRGVTS